MSKAIFQAHQWRIFPEQILSGLLFLCVLFSFPIDAKFTRALDQTGLELPPPMDSEMKCGVCLCSNPCSEQVTPPPLPPPPTPSPPPPPKVNCRPPAAVAQKPPPPPRFIYVTGVPGESSQSDSSNYDWIYYYNYSGGVAERPVDFLALTFWGLLSVVLIMVYV